MLVSDEVRRVHNSIVDVIIKLCTGKAISNKSTFILNAPDYLFVSTNLAKKFPHLMESIVVQSFVTHLPGESSKLWNIGTYWILLTNKTQKIRVAVLLNN